MTENVLISGTYMDPTIVSDLAAHNISATIVAPSQLQNTDLSQYSGLWLGYATNFDNSTGNLGDHISDFITQGGDVFAETPFTNDMSFLPGGAAGLPTTNNAGNNVHITDASNPLMAHLTDMSLSDWGLSYHETFGPRLVGPFKGVANTPDYPSGQWVTVERALGKGNLVLTGQNPTGHAVYGSFGSPNQNIAGPDGAAITLAVNALTLPG